MLKSELLQTYRCFSKQQTVRTSATVRTPKEQSHTQSDNVMCFVNNFFIITISTSNR
ncbi:hypothetical protein Hanom_Chr07g00610941 [Helianthus anomalus]